MLAGQDLLLLTHEFPPYPGGVARYCYSIGAAAARLGYNVTVLAPEHQPQSGTGSSDPPGVDVVRFPGDVFDIRRLTALRKIVAPLLARQSWQIVHAADWPMVMAIGGIGVAAGTQLTASLHGTDILLLRHSYRARCAGSAKRLRAFERVVFNSRFTADLFEHAFPKLKPKDALVAPLGVDTAWFEQPTEAAQGTLKQLIEYQPADHIVLTVARIDSRKGHLRTIAALGRLPAAIRSRIKYVCIGLVSEPALRERILKSANSQGVRVCLTGALPNELVHAAYSVADVFALTAEPMRKRIEGFGLVLLEAAAAGLASVVTAVHAIPSVVLDRRTGWISAPEDLDGIAANIAQALSTKTKAAMRDACIRHASSFTWEACAELTYGRSPMMPSSSAKPSRVIA